ncbi:coiled-coil-helix-coiled-coil-helix domain containing 3a isoform X2 [Eleginops maclovinus]|uniref:coiled-coil-helix-coiled-coil-helix domain containing 3a isoform X2 n=1 Tax=Eleginops maclovinus TaxID=56733 RepID=UPI0030807E2A
MGANNSTRRVSFESDENENITVVKGIRLSENVINRMREPEALPKAQPIAPPKDLPAPSPPPSMTPSITSSPFIRPVPPIFDHITPLPPLPPRVEPAAPPPPATTPTEQVAAPTIIDMVLPSSSVAAPAFEPVAAPPPPPPPQAPTEQTAEPFAAPPLPEFTDPCEPVALTPQPPVEPVSPAPVPELVVVPEVISIPPPPPPPPAAAPVDEVALRKTITDELHKDMEEDRAKAEQELQAWAETEKARAAAHAQDDAQSQVQSEVSRILSVERAVAEESIQHAVIRERIATEDERLRAQLFAKQLGAREADLKKQDAFYREQVARLEERSAQFYKVTTENYHKAADQVNAKFRRYETYPVCAELQGQILACYKENVGKTLNCSNIATLYLQCVNNTKQNKLRTGG